MRQSTFISGAIILLVFFVMASFRPSLASSAGDEAAVRASAETNPRYGAARPPEGTLLASTQFEPLLLFLLGFLLLSIATGLRWLQPRRPKAKAKPFRTDSA